MLLLRRSQPRITSHTRAQNTRHNSTLKGPQPRALPTAARDVQWQDERRCDPRTCGDEEPAATCLQWTHAASWHAQAISDSTPSARPAATPSRISHCSSWAIRRAAARARRRNNAPVSLPGQGLAPAACDTTELQHNPTRCCQCRSRGTRIATRPTRSAGYAPRAREWPERPHLGAVSRGASTRYT